ncbi:hypothetical protein E8E12_004986 [Didymella heteroderae]|uniref:Major facilitator superfamily (MFS) profile domain-containing protein n=1 Tax=Didymella heteroderae TaxID=1769908 RepID=A0A9P4WJR4_9PLEO|nr:hypothetical protein E8E12_004986 [Didymella heteroderae]
MENKQDVDIIHREDVAVTLQTVEDRRPWYKQPELRKLYLMMPFLFLGSTTLGYDGSLLNGLQTIPAWQAYFHHPTGSRLGLLGAFPGFGGFAVLLFTPYIADILGRRMGTAIGCVLVIVGSIIQALPQANNPDAMFLAGRFIMAAKQVLTKYHGNGEDNDFVNWEFNEISQTLKIEKAASASSGWYELVRTPGNRKRCLLIILTAIFSQCSGNGLVSYYLAAVLQTIGITNGSDQALINGGLTIWCFLVSLGCAFLVDRVGRRTLFLSAGVGMLVAFSIWTACSAVYAQTGNSSAGSAVLAMIFLFYGAAGIAWPGLTVSYTVEILPFNIRAKGLTLCFVFTSLSGIFNQYVNPIGIEALGWKFYIVYVVVLVLECLAIYFLYVETRGPTLEEIAILFDGEDANVAGANVVLGTDGLNDDNVIFAANESEVERLDKQHKVVYTAMPQLVLAPIELSKGGRRVLDQATGSGIWIRDVRQAASSASNTWVGTDIEDSYFPKTPPSDTSYFHQSMTKPWPTDWQATFDLVHSRMALPGIGLHPLEDVVKNLVALVKPGGWIQLVEMNWNGWEGGPVLRLFHDAMKQLVAMVTNGQGVDMRLRLTAILEDAGMTNLQHKIISVPLGAMAKEEVRDLSLQSMFATASFAKDTLKKLPPIDIAGEDLESMPQGLVKELKEGGGEYKLFAVWAQKPLPA